MPGYLRKSPTVRRRLAYASDDALRQRKAGGNFFLCVRTLHKKFRLCPSTDDDATLASDEHSNWKWLIK